MAKFRKVESKKKDPEELKAVELKLPSRGVPYEGDLSKAVLLVRPPNVEEVEYMEQMSPENYERNLSTLLRHIVIQPAPFDANDLTSGDRSFLHLWVRAQIHPECHIDQICPNCAFPHRNLPLSLSWDPEKQVGVPVEELDQKCKKLTEVKMPKSGQTVTLKIETGHEAIKADEMIKSGKVRSRARVAVTIEMVDGKKVTPEKAYDWMGKLPAGEDLFLAEFRKWTQHGPNFARCGMFCSKCTEVSQINLPFRSEFFVPTLPFERAFRDAVDGGDVQSGSGGTGVPGDQQDGVSDVSVAQEKTR